MNEKLVYVIYAQCFKNNFGYEKLKRVIVLPFLWVGMHFILWFHFQDFKKVEVIKQETIVQSEEMCSSSLCTSTKIGKKWNIWSAALHSIPLWK